MAESTHNRELAQSMLEDEFAKYHVICSTTGQEIPLNELRYWCVNDQKPYINSEAVDHTAYGYGKKPA